MRQDVRQDWAWADPESFYPYRMGRGRNCVKVGRFLFPIKKIEGFVPWGNEASANVNGKVG